MCLRHSVKLSMNGYKDLILWQKAMDLVDEVYLLLRYLPPEERYALSNQMRRAVISIPSNIAEGYERNSQSIRYDAFGYVATDHHAFCDL